MKLIQIFRDYLPEQTVSELVMVDENGNNLFHGNAIELKWSNNVRRESCIPEGSYIAIKHTSPKFGTCLWIQDVENRSEILIHPANYSRQLLGCIAPGMKLADIDKDGLVDVTESRKAMNKILELMGNDTKIAISIIKP